MEQQRAVALGFESLTGDDVTDRDGIVVPRKAVHLE